MYASAPQHSMHAIALQHAMHPTIRQHAMQYFGMPCMPPYNAMSCMQLYCDMHLWPPPSLPPCLPASLPPSLPPPLPPSLPPLSLFTLYAVCKYHAFVSMYQYQHFCEHLSLTHTLSLSLLVPLHCAQCTCLLAFTASVSPVNIKHILIHLEGQPIMEYAAGWAWPGS